MFTPELHRAQLHQELPRFVEPYDLLPLVEDQTHLCLLDGVREVTPLSRYSFLGFDPAWNFRSKRSECFAGPPGAELPLVGQRPFDALRALLRRDDGSGTLPAPPPGLPPFSSGACGYLGYELLYDVEDIPDLGRDDAAVPDSYLLFCQQLVSSDRQERRSWAVATGYGATKAAAEQAAQEKLRALVTRVSRFEERRSDERIREAWVERRRQALVDRPRLEDRHLEPLGIHPVVSREQYLDIVRSAREHILAGDIFEVCTTQRFDTSFTESGIDLYRILRAINPAPFSAYLRMGELEVMSSSPERFMRLDREGWAETRPIKGTRPRGKTPEDDAALVADLSSCVKDRAENVMIVDLARNDLGRVCRFGSVGVPQLMTVETYPYTHQLVSTVKGQLREGLDAVDLLRASFPGGSMTGAPKVEAMKIIDALEPVKRGVFSGSIGYLGYDGAFDLSIVIRTMVKVGDRMSFHVGGAIVADSDPAEEYQETLDKAHALVTAIEFCRRNANKRQDQKNDHDLAAGEGR